MMHWVEETERPKSPTSGQSKQKSPMDGRMTKVAYEWTIQSLQVDGRPKLPTGGRSK